MKLYIYYFFCIFAAGIISCRSDTEFGRASLEEDLEMDMEAALRELIVSYDMSMSMSMSFSYSYGGYGSSTGSGSNSYDDDDSNEGGSPNNASPSGTDTDSPNTSAAPAPTLSSNNGPSSVPIAEPTAPIVADETAPSSSPVQSPGITTSPSAVGITSPSLPSCFQLPASTFQSPLFVETSRSSVSFALLENVLTDAMRELLPFCDPSQRRLDELNVSIAGGDYYIGNVDLVGDASEETCSPKEIENNCFVAELTLKLFGNATDADVEDILYVVRELLETDSVGEALSIESSLIDDPTFNSTESDAGQGSTNAQSSGNSKHMSAGRKATIWLLGIAFVALAGFFAYRRFQTRINVASEGDGTMAGTADQEQLYGA